MSDGSLINFDKDYLISVPGVLKIIEIVLGVIVTICASVDKQFLTNDGGGFMMFVAVLGFVSTLVLFLLNLFTIFPRLPAWRLLLEFIYCIIFMIGYFIAGVIGAVHAPNRDPSISAGTFFSFMVFLAYAIDAFFAFWVWRAGVSQSQPDATANTTTATNTTASPANVANVQAGQVAY